MGDMSLILCQEDPLEKEMATHSSPKGHMLEPNRQ